MALFGKKTCPNCGQPQEKNWDKCPFCSNMGMGGGGMGGGMGGAPMGGGGMGGGGMGAAMGGGMGPPPGMGGFGGPPPPMGGGFGGGQPSGATQFGGGYGAPPPGGGFGGPPAGGGYGGAPSGGGSKTQMFMTSSGQSILLGWVIPLKGPNRGELHSLKGQSVIGKDPTCDICLNDSFLSSRHATIRQQGGVFVLEDHSTNGTFVNDKKVNRQELIDNDIVKLGQTLVKFKCL